MAAAAAAAAAASFNKKNSNLHVPEEITIEILSRLPVKSLMQFRCVCKTWQQLIRHDSNFVSQHLRQSMLNSKGGNLLLTTETLEVPETTYMDVFADGCFDAPIDSRKVLPSLRLLWGSHNIISNNGLLCVDSKVERSYAIWNPATRQFRTIPKLGVLNQATRNSELTQFLGFGVDVETNDYKLIIIRQHYNYRGKTFNSLRVEPIEVYSKMRGSWRGIEATALTTTNKTDHQPLMLHERCSQIQVKGVLYWVSRSIHGRRSNYQIMGFEIREEKFVVLPMPENKGNGIHDSLMLTEIDGSLAFISDDSSSNNFHVWTKNEHGEGWVVIYKIEPFIQSCHVEVWKNYLVVWKPAKVQESNEFVLSVQRLDGGDQPSVGSDVQEIKNTLCPCGPDSMLRVHKYVESLAHV